MPTTKATEIITKIKVKNIDWKIIEWLIRNFVSASIILASCDALILLIKIKT